MSNPNSYQTDQYVEWNWGNGKGKGQVKERFEREVTRTLQGTAGTFAPTKRKSPRYTRDRVIFQGVKLDAQARRRS